MERHARVSGCLRNGAALSLWPIWGGGIAVVLLLTALGCVTANEFRGPSGERMVEITCPGTARSWSDCFQRAAEECPNGYEVVGQHTDHGQLTTWGTHGGQSVPTVARSLVVACKPTAQQHAAPQEPVEPAAGGETLEDVTARRSRLCENDLSVSAVSGDGEILVLDDGSVWEIDPIDRLNAALWLPSEEIIVCGSEIINTDNAEKVSATRLK